MKSGIFITARLGSTRLPQKHFKIVNGKEIIRFLVERTIKEFSKEIIEESVIVSIVSGNEKMNKALDERVPECDCYFGNDNNIPLRHLEAADHYGVDCIVSVDGDDILCSPAAMRAVFNGLNNGRQYVKTEGLPLGLNVMGYRREFLRSSLGKTDSAVLETGWGRIFDEDELKIFSFECRNDPFLRFTLDYEEDFDFFNRILTDETIDFLNCSDNCLVEKVLKNKIYEINRSIAETYWDNFNAEMDKEKENG
jgi:spore coat polysaccharide biosynthesis protein SpsF (cytidylyltransferase family)